MDLTKSEDINKRWEEYTEELYKKDLHDPDNHSGMITHLKPDILECKVKWALGSIIMIKANGGERVPVELFQILKDSQEEPGGPVPEAGSSDTSYRGTCRRDSS